jgi:CheY-like chemotaxis protein
MVLGDAARFRQVITCLVGNAIKFTDHGGIAVRTALEHGTSETATVRVTVSDTGIGIPPERRADLFDSFVQGDDSATRRHGGTGLGLAISKRLVQMMGGRIGFESEPGAGTTFWFTAVFRKYVGPEGPRGAHGHAGRQASGAIPEATEAAGVRVLLAEDNEVNQRVALRMLDKSGFLAEAVLDGRQAVDAVLRGRYDVVLMDVHMPGMDGLSATAEIRAREDGTRHTPIIAMTARALAGDREECLAAGMDDYISKPIQMDELRRMIRRWANNGSRARGPGASGSASRPSGKRES